MTDPTPLIDKALPALVDLRHELHQHPELKYEERWTAARVVQALEGVPGLDIRQGVARTGVVATLGADKPGPCLALRADMDALPIREETGRPYASLTEGKMHACGHDGHTTCLVGAVRVLSQLADQLEGPVKFLFQPAEEGGAGGRLMCEEGVLDDPPVQAVFGLHGWPSLEVGQVGLCPGGFLASSDSFEIVVEGQGAHAAFPHQGVDPVLIAAHITTALQSVVSRTTDPLDSVVVTVAQIHAGTAFNIIPPSAEVKGTLRALDAATRQRSIETIERLVHSTAQAFGGRARVAFLDGYPALVNDSTALDFVKDAAAAVRADGQQVPPVMGGEDFAFYAQRVPAAFFALGLRGADQASYPSLHQPDFDFADAAIPLGVRMHVELAQRFARQWGGNSPDGR